MCRVLIGPWHSHVERLIRFGEAFRRAYWTVQYGGAIKWCQWDKGRVGVSRYRILKAGKVLSTKVTYNLSSTANSFLLSSIFSRVRQMADIAIPDAAEAYS